MVQYFFSTNRNTAYQSQYVPYQYYVSWCRVVGWTIAGFLSKDKAILTNFGLQIPLFLIGFYQIIFN